MFKSGVLVYILKINMFLCYVLTLGSQIMSHMSHRHCNISYSSITLNIKCKIEHIASWDMVFPHMYTDMLTR